MRFKVFKVTHNMKQTLEFQLDIGDVRPGTSHADVAVAFVLKKVAHQVSDVGVRPLMDSDGVHLTKWLVLDDTDIYWFLPTRMFGKSPEAITVPIE